MLVLAGVALSAVPVKLETSVLRVKVEEEFELVGEDDDGRPFLARVRGDDLMCSIGVRNAADGLESPFTAVLVEAEVEPRVGGVAGHPQLVGVRGLEHAVEEFAAEFPAEESADRKLRDFGDVFEGGHTAYEILRAPPSLSSGSNRPSASGILLGLCRRRTRAGGQRGWSRRHGSRWLSVSGGAQESQAVGLGPAR